MDTQQMIGAVYESNLKKHIKDAIANKLRSCSCEEVREWMNEDEDGVEDGDE